MFLKGNQGRFFVLAVISVALAALILRFVVERVIMTGIDHNEVNAANTLKLIAAALDNYAEDHNGVFPSNFAQLVHADPSYLDSDYPSLSSLEGYVYSCPSIEASGYSCRAVPSKCGLSGRNVYMVTTGGPIASEPCAK